MERASRTSVYAQTRSTLGFAKPRLFEQAAISLPNRVCQRSEGADCPCPQLAEKAPFSLSSARWSGHRVRPCTLKPAPRLASRNRDFLNKLPSRCQTGFVNDLRTQIARALSLLKSPVFFVACAMERASRTSVGHRLPVPGCFAHAQQPGLQAVYSGCLPDTSVFMPA